MTEFCRPVERTPQGDDVGVVAVASAKPRTPGPTKQNDAKGSRAYSPVAYQRFTDNACGRSVEVGPTGRGSHKAEKRRQLMRVEDGALTKVKKGVTRELQRTRAEHYLRIDDPANWKHETIVGMHSGVIARAGTQMLSR
jgi:hypothetical protein